jgi:S-adenosylmethionine:tRNA ribosyltransferase-isomerase
MRSSPSTSREPPSDAPEPLAARDLECVAAYRYALPPELIATAPAEPADASRLLEVRADGSLADRRFFELPELLEPGDVLAINETRVIRARLRGTREPGGGAVEVLLLRPLDRPRYASDALRWTALVKPGRRLRAGARIAFGEAGVATVEDVREDGTRVVAFRLNGTLEGLLDAHGEMPLPPYVGPGDETRAARYQTLFARVPGSVAAPTASLHFTPRVMAALRARGVEIVPVVLDVGYGTFKPMEGERLDAHRMHAERYEISTESAAALEAARREGRRIVAAGTTVLRALESAALDDGSVRAGERETALFIRPGFEFRVASALLTNFHLPASTLLVLVAAFAGYAPMRAAYAHAIAERYRFYSFGDAMLIERPKR